ncbi:MAG: hydrogen gas-evolving membrane-bound hydrogenase subunit E [Acidimicrobiales bacterium]
MGALLAVYVVVALVVGLGGRRLGRRVFLVALVPNVAVLAWAAVHTPEVLDGATVAEGVSWVPQLGLDLDLRLGALGLTMTWLISGIGSLVAIYAFGYFGERDDLGRFAATLLVFGAAMCGVVWSDNLLALFVFWELTSISSYALIGFDNRTEAARNAALQALLVTGAGGLALLAGIVLIGIDAGTYSLSALSAAPPTGATIPAAAVLVLIGACTKSAQVPFHGWLSAAMAAPTPVSAYLHSATMVKAGVFAVAVLTPVLGDAGPWVPLTVGVGTVTMVWGSYQSLRHRDLKLVLASSTIAALGLLIALFGIGIPEATFAAVAVLVAHAVQGVRVHGGRHRRPRRPQRDLYRLRGLRHRLPVVAGAAAVAGASMAAIPLTFGFVGKEVAIEALLHGSGTAAVVLLVALVAFSAMTAAAVWRFWQGAFTDGPPPPPGIEVREPVDPATVHTPALATVAPAVLLAAAGAVLGVVPALIDPLVSAAAVAVDPTAAGYALHVITFGPALALSLAALVLAGGLVAAARPIAALQQRLVRPWTAATAFRSTVAGLLLAANAVVGVVQSGSLPQYLGVILVTAAVAPGLLLIGSSWFPADAVWAESPLQLATVVAVVACALGVVLVRRRFAAVMILGAVGYVVGVLFIAYDAPDLALTQFLVETVIVVAFVLVLRRLPDRFDIVRWRMREAWQIGVSVIVGVTVFGFLLASGGPAPQTPTDAMVARAGPDGGGANVVNVILTDIRALDTLGEITVVAVAALGVLALTALLRPRRDGDDAPSGTEAPAAAPPPFLDAVPSSVLDAAVRVTFPIVMVLALFLLLSGHDAPGGGFVAGLVAAAGLVLRAVAQPDAPPLRWERVDLLVGGGLLVAVGVAAASWPLGTDVLDMGAVSATIPILGTVKIGGALVFDLGVFAVVLGTMVAILHGLGRRRLPGPPGTTPTGTAPPLRKETSP